MTRTFAEAVTAALDEALAQDGSVVLLGESATSGGVAGTTRGLVEKHGAERVIDVPIAEHGTIAMAVGMAFAGRRPIVEITSSGRLLSVIEPLAEAAAVSAAGEFAAPLVVRVPVGNEAGPRIDAQVGELLAAIDGLVVAAASTPDMAAALIRQACRARGPVVLLEARSLYAVRGDVGEGSWPFGQARLLREGAHVTIAAWGSAVAAATQAARTLAAEGIEADVIDLVSLAPLDLALVGDRTRATGRLLLAGAEDGLAERLLRAATREAFEYLESPPTGVGSHAEAVAEAARSAVQLWF